MKVPTSLLPHRITVEAYLGSTGEGETYGTAQPGVRARVERKRRAVRLANGTDLVGTATAIVRPEVDIAAEARVTLPDGDVLYVLGVAPAEGLTRPAYHELILGVLS